MTLTKNERKYLDIVSRHLLDKEKPNSKIAAELNICRQTVDKAITWGNNNNILSALSGNELPKNILYVNKQMKWLEKQRDKMVAIADSENRMLSSAEIKAFSQELREWFKTRLELTGARAAVTVEHKHELSLSPDMQEMLNNVYDKGSEEVQADYTVVHDDTGYNYDNDVRKYNRRMQTMRLPYNGDNGESDTARPQAESVEDSQASAPSVDKSIHNKQLLGDIPDHVDK